MKIKPSLLLLACLFAAVAHTQSSSDLHVSFQNPPNAARPRVWWHWMNGNVTKQGIQKDLEWMVRAGIGGFQNFDANLFTPQVVDKKLVFMTPDWKDAFRFAAELADQKGLEMAIAGSPGWSVTGGPWVPAKDGMKKYVWSEMRVAGGQKFSGKLPQPAATTGRFQNVAIGANTMMGGEIPTVPTYYEDARVVAYRLPQQEKTLAELQPKVSSSGGHFTLSELTDGDLNRTAFLPPMAVGEDMWIQYEFATPQTFKAISLVGAIHTSLEDFDGGPLNRRLKVSDDGVNYREIAAFTGSVNPQNTIAFAPVTAKYWRIAFETLPPPFNLFAAMAGQNPVAEKSDGVQVAEFVLHNTTRVDQFEDKAGFTPWKEDNATFLPDDSDAISTADFMDITPLMQADGSLQWQVPSGNWVILRFGFSLTGRQNHPASPEATGLEVDKLDKDAVRQYINTYLDMYKDATGGLMGPKGLQYMILDSYEAGHMTWTRSLPEEFAKRRGYSLYFWLPVLTGRVVHSALASEHFLWDFRKTIGELIAEHHYDVIGEELHKRGMKRYTESHEDRRIYLADGMDVKRHADIPMSAMWTPGSLGGSTTNEEVRSEADIRESASVAHLYGKPFVAAESMTSVNNAFSFSPEKLKRTADLEMASGLNRFVIHTSVHQPLDDKVPGFSLGPFGQYFGRQETWAEQARVWVDYLSRSCYLLQQGRFVADALIYYGENTNLTWRFKAQLPEIAGYEYDFVNASALLNILTVKDGKITTPGGGSYSVLVLDESAKQMTLPVLKKLRELVKAGARVTGVKPHKSPSLSDNINEFRQIADEIWSNPNVSAASPIEVLQSQGIQADVVINNAKARILYVHRQMPNTDIYWLNNRSAETNEAEISFRCAGKLPELWHPQTGKVEMVSWQIKNGRAVINLKFDPWEAYFIVFNENTKALGAYVPPMSTTEISRITTPWQVSFQEKRGAPASAVFSTLASLSENADPGIKYFSGTASYRNSFIIKKINKNSRTVLDLGEVKNLAEVVVNGKNLGILWKTPFAIDITDAVTQGKNTLELRVTNLWVNRLIGDAQPGTTDKITFTTMPFYRAGDPLLPSGLMGPVILFEKK